MFIWSLLFLLLLLLYWYTNLFTLLIYIWQKYLLYLFFLFFRYFLHFLDLNYLLWILRWHPCIRLYGRLFIWRDWFIAGSLLHYQWYACFSFGHMVTWLDASNLLIGWYLTPSYDDSLLQKNPLTLWEFLEFLTLNFRYLGLYVFHEGAIRGFSSTNLKLACNGGLVRKTWSHRAWNTLFRHLYDGVQISWLLDLLHSQWMVGNSWAL